MTLPAKIQGISRRNLLKIAGVGAFIAAGVGNKVLTNIKADAQEAANVTTDQALQMLMEGNQRFVAKKLTHRNQTAQREAEVAKEQHPFAVILGCADSRVPPEIIFDEGLGDLFVVRVAGNIVDNAIIASIEYAADHLGTPLVMVLGHQRCGAVAATLKGGELPGHISTLAEAIAPAINSTKNQPGDQLDNCVRANVKMVVDQLKSSQPVLSEFVKAGKLKIVGGRYDLETGRVDIIA